MIQRKMPAFLVTLFILLFLPAALFGEYSSGYEKNPDYDKTFSLGINVPSLLFTGPIVEAAYLGLGPVGFYGSFGYASYGIGIADLEDKSNTSIYGMGGGIAVKFFYNYKKKYHDSGYFGAQTFYSYLNAKDTGGNVLKGHSLNGHFIFGWRWQWSLVYIDLNFGLGYGRYFKYQGAGSFDAASKAEIEKNTNKWYSSLITWSIVVGVAF